MRHVRVFTLDNKSGRNWGFWERSGQKSQWSPFLLSSMCAIFSPHRTLSNPDILGDFRDFRRLRWMLNLLHCARRQSDVALAETLWQSWQKAVADADGTGCPAAEQEK